MRFLTTLSEIPSCKTLKKVMLFDTLSFDEGYHQGSASEKLCQFVDQASALEELDIRGGCKREDGGLVTLTLEPAQFNF